MDGTNLVVGILILVALALPILLGVGAIWRARRAERRRLQANLDSVYNQRERRLRGN